jgi:hypothetical protein
MGLKEGDSMSKRMNILLGLIGVSILGLFGEKRVKADESLEQTSQISTINDAKTCEELPPESDLNDCLVTPEFLEKLKERGILETKFAESSVTCGGQF